MHLAGKMIAEATRAARNRAQEQGDATWLAYVVYANPAATMARSLACLRAMKVSRLGNACLSL
jgi:hypothetical protein